MARSVEVAWYTQCPMCQKASALIRIDNKIKDGIHKSDWFRLDHKCPIECMMCGYRYMENMLPYFKGIPSETADVRKVLGTEGYYATYEDAVSSVQGMYLGYMVDHRPDPMRLTISVAHAPNGVKHTIDAKTGKDIDWEWLSISTTGKTVSENEAEFNELFNEWAANGFKGNMRTDL